MILVFLPTAKPFLDRMWDKFSIAHFVQRQIQHLRRKRDICIWQPCCHDSLSQTIGKRIFFKGI
jgi:hypothetical protein